MVEFGLVVTREGEFGYVLVFFAERVLEEVKVVEGFFETMLRQSLLPFLLVVVNAKDEHYFFELRLVRLGEEVL